MAEVPFHLRYPLTRGQRMGPHLRIWGRAILPFVLAVFALFLALAGFHLSQYRFWDGSVFLLFALLVFLLFRGLFLGIVDVLVTRTREMDVVVDEDAAGVLVRGQRCYLFLDGFCEIRKYRSDIWTLHHRNGVVLNLPTTAISESHLDHIRAAIERGRTPEGIRAVIERGRRIREITKRPE
jgi:hypothetical protein